MKFGNSQSRPCDFLTSICFYPEMRRTETMTGNKNRKIPLTPSGNGHCDSVLYAVHEVVKLTCFKYRVLKEVLFCDKICKNFLQTRIILFINQLSKYRKYRNMQKCPAVRWSNLITYWTSTRNAEVDRKSKSFWDDHALVQMDHHLTSTFSRS